MRRSLKILSPYIDTITFGGGEPLLFFEGLCNTVREVYYLDRSRLENMPRRYLITSGPRELFFKCLVNTFVMYFHNVYLTRLRLKDEDNQKAFGTDLPIVTTEDLKYLPDANNYLNDRMEIVTTCYKGGCETVGEMMGLIYWTAKLEVSTIIFNDLQCDVTNFEYYQEHQIDDGIFEQVIQNLKSYGFEEKIEVCFSGGYTIRMYEGTLEYIEKYGIHKKRYRQYIRVGFKQYHKPGTTLDVWKKANKRTFDISIMPNGEVFSDWANNNKVIF